MLIIISVCHYTPGEFSVVPYICWSLNLAIVFSLFKVCNHPDLFEPRPIISPFQMERFEFYTASLAFSPLTYTPLQVW